MGQVESRASAVYGIKNDISAAIESRGVSLSGVTFGGYAAKIGEIQGGGIDPSSANAVASNVFSGKTFYAVDSSIHTGTMPTAAVTSNATSFGVTSGYLSAAAGVSYINPAAANAVASNVYPGKTFYAGNSTLKTGIMPLAAVSSGAASTSMTSGYFSGGVVASYINPAAANASAAAVRSGQTFFAVDSAIKTGTMPDSVVTSGATATVITSGYLPNAVTVTTGGGGGGTLGELVNVSELLSSGQVINNNVMQGSGVLVKALSGATVCGNTVMPGVEVLVYSGAVESANATSGGVLLTPSDATYYGSMFTANRVVQSGESLFNCSCSDCTVTAVSGATVYDHHAASNGYLNVSSGALVKYVECLSRGRLTVLQGGSVHSVGLSGNYCSLTVRSAGTVTNVSVTADPGDCIVSSGGLLSGLYSDRQIWIRTQLYGGTLTGLQAISAEVKLMSSGSLLSGASCGQYYITATAGTTVTDVYASGGLAVSVLSGGSLCNASAVNAGLSCFAQVSSGGYYVSNVHFSNVYNYGFFNVSVMNSSCTMLDTTFGAITVSFSNGVLPASQTYKGQYMTWTIGGGVQTDGWFHSGYSMWMIVSSGGLAANHTVGYDAAFDISAGGSASGVIVSSGAWFRVFSGGKAWDVAVSNAYGQRTWVYSSGSMFGATVESRADLRLSGLGAYCSRPVISSGGLLVVSSGAFAQDVVSMPGATVTSMTGATVTYST